MPEKSYASTIAGADMALIADIASLKISLSSGFAAKYSKISMPSVVGQVVSPVFALCSMFPHAAKCHGRAMNLAPLRIDPGISERNISDIGEFANVRSPVSTNTPAEARLRKMR